MVNVNTLLDDHVTLRYESIDRLFLNGYLPRLQTPEGLARFLRDQPGEEISRYAILGERTAAFNRALERFAEANQIPLVHFEKGDRKEAVAQPYLDRAEAAGREGAVLIGIAQERASVFRPPAMRDRVPGRYGVRRTSAYINHVYFYLWDAEFGGAFIKLCTYAPWSLRVWLNGHSWAKRQLEGRHIGYQPLDNGFAAAASGRALQDVCDSLSAAAIERFVRRWLAILPSPLSAADGEAGYGYELSILQLEISCTEVFDRPLHGRQFFESVIADQLDLGRPEKLQLIFGHRILRRRAAAFRTRVFGAGANPSLHVEAPEHEGQAVLEARPRAADRDDDQRQLRLRHRAAAGQPARARRDRPGDQPPADRARADRPALRARGGHVRGARSSDRPARCPGARSPLRRPARRRPVRRAGRLPLGGDRHPEPLAAGARGGPPRRALRCPPDGLRPPPPHPQGPPRAPPPEPPLPAHRARPAARPVLHEGLQPCRLPRARRDPPGPAPAIPGRRLRHYEAELDRLIGAARLGS